MTKSLNHHSSRYNPIHVAAACATLVLALVMLLDPLFPPSPASQANAVGGHVAIDVIGQLTGDDQPIFTEGGVDNSPNSRGFSGPEGVTIDAVHHRLFAVDPGNHRVMVFNLDTDNQLIDRIADHVLGQLDFRSNGNGTDQAKMTYPLYSAYDPDNDLLFVSDYSNNRVMVFDVENITDGENAIHVLGQPDFTTTTVVLSDTGMSNPRGVAYDPTTSRLFVGSQDHQRVLVYDLLGGITNGMAASWVLGQEDFNSSGPNLDQDGLSAGNNLTLDIDGQRLFVDDSAFSRVMVWDISGTITNGQDATNVIGQEDFTSGGSDLDIDSLDFSGLYGNGLAHDPDNERLFVADGSNRRVMVFDVDPSVLVPNDPGSDGPDAINVLGQTDFTSEDDSLSQHSTRAAGGLAYDADNGLLYTTTKGDVGQENPDNRSSIFDVNTIDDGEDAVDLLGQLDENDAPFYTSRGVDNTPNQLGFDGPNGVAVDLVNHRLFTTDFNNNRVLVFELDADNSPTDYAADFVIGQPDFKSTASAAADPQAYNFNNGPQTVIYEPDRNFLYVSDANGNRILIFDLTGGITNGMSATSVLGQPDFTTHDCCTTDAGHFVSSEGMALDDLNNILYVPDGFHNRVLVFDVATIANGEDAINVLGQPDFTTDTAGSGSSGMDSPSGAAVDVDNQRIFVTDANNNRVLVFDGSDGIDDGEDAVNVLGQNDFVSTGSNLSQSGLDGPHAPLFEGDGPAPLLYVSDMNNNRVMVFDTTTITDGEDAVDAYGQPDFTSNGCGTSRSTMCTPGGLTHDADRDILYVADTSNNRMMIFSPPEPTGSHEATDVVGQLDDTDQPIFTTGGADNGPNRRGSSEPVAVEVDHINHRLFMADYDNGRVLVYDLNNSDEMVDRVADYVLGQDNFKDGVCGTAANRMCNPGGLALDEANGLLFIGAYGNNSVRVFDVNEVTSGEDAVNVLGQPDFDSSTAEVSQTGMNHPGGVEWYEEDQELFVVDFDNNRVLVFDLSGGITTGMPASHVLGQPDFDTNTPGTSATTMDRPAGIEYVGAAPSGLEHLYIADRFNCRVIAFDISTIDDGEAADLVLGQSDLNSEDCGADNNSFGENGLANLSHDEANGLLFVTDFGNNRVMVFDVTDIDTDEDAVTVLGQPDFTSSAPSVGAEGLNDPEGVYYDDANDLLYITDTGNHRVLTYDGTALVNGMAAGDGFNQLNPDDTVNFTANKPNNGPNRQGLDTVSGLALDSVYHRLFLTEEENNRVLVFDLDDRNQLLDYDADFVIGQPDFKSRAPGTSASTVRIPRAVSYDGCNSLPSCPIPHDRLFVADPANNRVLVYDFTVTPLADGMDATNVLGQPDFDSGDCNQGGGPDANTLCAPEWMSIEPLNGILAISDGGNNRVLMYDVSAGITDGMSAERVFGQPDMSSDDAGTSDSEMTHPVAVLAETKTDSLWVADYDNNRVLQFDLFGLSSDPAVAVLGQPNFTSNACATTQAGMCSPAGLALIEADGTGQRLFVGDEENKRVLVFNTADGVDNGEDAVDAYGQPDFTTADCTTSSIGMCNLSAVDYDELSRTLYVADWGNNRVLIFGPTGGGNPQSTPEPVGITPERIVVNQDSSVTDSRNVLVTVWATNTANFTGTVDVLLSNDPMFSTFIPFRYNVPGPSGEQNIWPKTIAWDLCFGLSVETCDSGHKTVYARFYVNVPLPSPVLTPRPVQ